jgi:hypothetical protein
MLRLLADLPARAEAHFSRAARTLEQIRNAFVLAPIFWTWLSLTLLFYGPSQAANPQDLDILERWENSWITLETTVVVAVGLIGWIFALSLLIAWLDTRAQARLGRFVIALEHEVWSSLNAAMKVEERRWGEIRDAFANGPERVRTAADALITAIEKEKQIVSEIGQEHLKELDTLRATGEQLKKILGNLERMTDHVKNWGEREDAALKWLATTLVKVDRGVENLPALLDELQRDRELSIDLLGKAASSLRDAANRLQRSSRDGGRATSRVSKSS